MNTREDLEAMAARAEEDGYDRAWMPFLANSRRDLDAMHKAADAAKLRAEMDAKRFVPNRGPNG